MINLLKKIDPLSSKQLFWCLPIAAALLAGWMQYIQHGWINPDSVLYFEAAKLFAVGQWQLGFNIFPWPLYSLCIALVHKITGLDVQLSAQLLHAIFFSITTFSFLKIIQLTGGGTRVLLAGALILFSSQYLVGDILEMLMRDQGFWAFFLSSLVFFIKFYKTKLYQDAIFWQICIIIATLFRIEGISYLIFLPVILLLEPHIIWQLRIRSFLKCHLLNIALGVIILGALLLSNNLSMSNFGRLNEVFTFNIFQELTLQLRNKSAIMSQQVLGKYLEDFAMQGLLLTFIYVMVAKAVSSTGIINVGLAMFATKSNRQLMDNQAFRVLRAAAIIAIINMALIITKVFVLSGRYVLALSLILMIFASFYLITMFKYLESNSDKKLKWLTIALIGFMMLSFVKNILPKAEGYNYMQDAVAWVQANNKDNKPVFYDDSRVRYHAGAPFVGTGIDSWFQVKSAIENQSIQQYDFLLITHSAKHPEREKLITEKLTQYSEVKRFISYKAKKTLIIYSKQ
ncbi:MAG: hypothetical protein ABL880_05375 [Methylotenera sp.]